MTRTGKRVRALIITLLAVAAADYLIRHLS